MIFFHFHSCKKKFNLIPKCSRGELREAPPQIKHHLERKQYIAGTNLLNSAVKISDNELAGVDALKEVRADLLTKRHALQTKLMEVSGPFYWVESILLHRNGLFTSDSA